MDSTLQDLGYDLIRPDLARWTATVSPFAATRFHRRTVQARYAHNGYEWDVRGTLFLPETESLPGIGFVMTHGGAGSEMELVETPDGRPGLAAVLAARGFRVLAWSFPGHLPASGHWDEPVSTRQPCYLLDRSLEPDEVAARMECCTFDTIVAGAAALTDAHMVGYRLLSFGHSTGGPMAVALQRFLRRAEVIGVVGWGSGGPDGWYREWMLWVGNKAVAPKPPGSVARRTVESFRQAGYEDPVDLCPWGGAEAYFQWADRYKAQFKTALCDNQHNGCVEVLRQTAVRMGRAPEAYLAYLRDPDPDWLAGISVLLCVGEADRNHWGPGQTDRTRLESFMAHKFAMRTRGARLVVLPRYGHFGFVGAFHHAIAHTWLEGLSGGFFPNP